MRIGRGNFCTLSQQKREWQTNHERYFPTLSGPIALQVSFRKNQATTRVRDRHDGLYIFLVGGTDKELAGQTYYFVKRSNELLWLEAETPPHPSTTLPWTETNTAFFTNLTPGQHPSDLGHRPPKTIVVELMSTLPHEISQSTSISIFRSPHCNERRISKCSP